MESQNFDQFSPQITAKHWGEVTKDKIPENPMCVEMMALIDYEGAELGQKNT